MKTSTGKFSPYQVYDDLDTADRVANMLRSVGCVARVIAA